MVGESSLSSYQYDLSCMSSTEKTSPEESVSRLSSARKLLVLALIGGVIFSIVYFVFFRPSEANRYAATAPAQTAEPQFVKEGELSFLEGTSQDTLHHIDIEIADDRAAQMQGLMYRSSMAEDHGMLFPYPDARPLSFFMKNMKMSIDIIFVGADRRIVTIHQAVAPYSEKSLPSGEDAQYVVEVNAGFTARHGIKEGDLISFERMS